MRLIQEISEDDSIFESVLNEATGKKELFIEGIFLQKNIKNRNGRIYPGPVMDKAVSNYVTEYVNNGRAFGELSHPQGPSINLDRVSHIITELKADGDNYMGKAKITEGTNMGATAAGIINAGGKLGVSSRGMGTIKEHNGANIVQDDFMLATAADIVADPSAPSAFVNGIYENKEWIWENSALKEVDVQEIKDLVEENVKKDKNLALTEAKAFKLFMDKITKV